MAFSLDKIKLGRKNKNAFFDFSHDVNTTSDFGFCQPTIVTHLIPGSKISLKSNAFVRLAPLVSPSFARVRAEIVTRFVPLTDVFEGFNYMQAEKTVQSFNASYIPTNADFITVGQLVDYIFRVSLNSNFGANGHLALPVMFKHDGEGNAIPVKSWLAFPSSTTTYPFSVLNSSTYLPNYLNHAYLFREDNASIYDEWNVYVLNCYNNDLPMEGPYSYIGKPTIDNADFVFMRSDEEPEDDSTVIAYYLTKAGKRFMKILYGLGIDFTNLHARVPMHLFYAYFKAWFDTFNPGREQHWRGTYCYRLIHSYYDTNFALVHILGDDVDDDDPRIGWFVFFMKSLLNCCYSLDVDPLTVCMANPWSNNPDSEILSQTLTGSEFDEDPRIDLPWSFNGPAYDSRGSLDSISLLVLQKSLSFLSKDSVLAHKIKDLLKVRYNITSFEESHFVGSSGFNLQISDVTNLAQSDGNPLGEYAGKGVGTGETDNMKYTTTEYGILVQFLYIKPIGGYSQASLTQCLVDKNDFYQPDFDSVGYEAVPKSAIFGSTFIPNYDGEEIFGFRPRYMSLKYMTNLRNGEFRNRSQRDYFSTYHLDRVFDERHLIYTANGILSNPGVNIQSAEILRFIGQTESFGNYNRLFYDNSGNSDNFIVHMFNDFKVWAPMLPISESFMTYDDNLNGDTDTISVQHS